MSSESRISENPLSPEHLDQISVARQRARRIVRAAAIASFSGWSMLAFAVLTLAFAFLSDWTAWAIGSGLALCALNELRGGAMLRRLEPGGARVLGWNQVFLGVLLTSYAVWSLVNAERQPSIQALSQGTGDPQIDAMAKDLVRFAVWAVYGTMAVVGVLVPGLTAIYYFSRGRLVRRIRAETPPWVLEVLRRR